MNAHPSEPVRSRRHYWHAPTIPVGTPDTATAVVKTGCGMRRSLPVWQVNEWAASSDPTPTPHDCPMCVAAVDAGVNR